MDNLDADEKPILYYQVRRPLKVPLSLTVIVFVCAPLIASWVLLAIPFIWLGAICAAPNLNLVDGWLAWVALLFGVTLFHFHQPNAGIPIVLGTGISYIFSSFQMYTTAVPIYEYDEKRSDTE